MSCFRVEDVFDWLFEVDVSPRAHPEVGRLAFVVSYSRSGRDAIADRVQRKIVGSVSIQNDSVQAIVPVTKVT